MRQLPIDIGTIHFIGIGGIGMSGIAETLHALGYAVQGSDIAESSNVARLRERGIEVFIGHDAGNLASASIVVISSAISSENEELAVAREMRMPVVRRAEMLAELMHLKWAIAVAGTHGKTTTTSMVASMLEAGRYDPTVINGGIINHYGATIRLGASDWMVAEADESDGTFTKLPATVAVVTNIDPEHMEHYGSFDEVRRAYYTLLDNLPFYGFAVLCADHAETRTLGDKLRDKRVITYGYDEAADIRAHNIRAAGTGQYFDVAIAGWLCDDGTARELSDIFLPMPGAHNVQNACAALSIAFELGMDDGAMLRGLSEFTGVKRRFTKTGNVNGVTIIDDYAHHPVEIGCVLEAGRQSLQATGGRLIAVMQPHRYSRLHDLMNDFCKAFDNADTVIIADVYSAGEAPIDGADKAHLAQGIRDHGHRDVRELAGREDLAPMIADIAEPGDMVILLGAGDITKWANQLPGALKDMSYMPQSQKAL
jgi:UDP-N-acetylmuramate--alanine ligase